jgi:hypothetical protein
LNKKVVSLFDDRDYLKREVVAEVFVAMKCELILLRWFEFVDDVLYDRA